MTSCSSCGKQNQDHYRFCLGCGAEMPRGSAAPPPPAPPVAEELDEVEEPIDEPLDEEPMVEAEEASPPPPPPAPAPRPAAPRPAAASPAAVSSAASGTCSECGASNAPTNRFCASCGAKIGAAKGATPAAAPPRKKTAVPAERPAAVLVALDAEGNDIGRFELHRGETVVGRETGGVFADDTFLSPKHARFQARDGRLTVRDASSLNGVFRRIVAEQPCSLQPGQMFRIGQELLQFDLLAARGANEDGVVRLGAEPDGAIGRVSLVVGRNTRSPSIAVPERGLQIGRERGDVTFPDDGYVSGLHCSVTHEEGDVFLTDLGSSNGTFLQLLGEVELGNGDVLLMGQQLFRVTI